MQQLISGIVLQLFGVHVSAVRYCSISHYIIMYYIVIMSCIIIIIIIIIIMSYYVLLALVCVVLPAPVSQCVAVRSVVVLISLLRLASGHLFITHTHTHTQATKLFALQSDTINRALLHHHPSICLQCPCMQPL